MTPQKTFQIDGQEVIVKNPDKVIVLENGFTKLDFIHYYQAVEEAILHFGKGRLLSFLRYPEGYPGKSFFQRNKPKWAPEWIHSQQLGIFQKADYIILENLAILIWLVNLEALEFHVAQVAAPHFAKPDVLVFDLDPPIDCEFSELRDFVFKIKPRIESFGYRTFVKISGKKGIHVFCPIQPNWSFDQVFEAAKEVGESIVADFPESTLKISKDKRLDKILIDIYRNHSYQSMALPYGIRATPSASVSMPLSWEDLKKVKSPREFTIQTAPDWIKNKKNPWESMEKEAVKLHQMI